MNDDGPTLADRAEALEGAAELARGRLDDATVETARSVADKVRARLRHGTDRTVIALAGPTGAGKSSLFNAIVGSDVSTPGVKRPTTSVAHAALWGGDEPRLLRWLEVPRRFLVDEEHSSRPPDGRLDGLVLVDLPDVDSVETSNRLEAARLIEVVDAFVWVVDPQKYADEIVHGHIAEMSNHADVMRFALTKMDLVPAAERDRLVGDLVGRLNEAGIPEPVVWPVSVANGSADAEVGGDGVGVMLDGLAEVVSEQKSLVVRLGNDLSSAAAPMRTDDHAPVPSVQQISDAALDEVAAAAKVGELASAVSTEYQRRARRSTGWLPLEWVRRRRPSAVTTILKPGTIDRLRIESALRSAAEAGAGNVGAPWDQIVRREVMGRSDDVADSLRTRSLHVAKHVGSAPRWWSVVAMLQRLLLLAAVVGIAWLLGVAVAGGLGLATDPLIIKVGPTPVPSALVIGGIGLGIIFGLLARLPASAGGKRRARSARREMLAETAEVLEREIAAPIEHVLADRAEIDRLATVAAGGDPAAPTIAKNKKR